MTSLEVEPRVSTKAFMKGLLASLVVQETTHLTTLNNEHQNRFRKTVETLDDPDLIDPSLRERLPTLIPSPITGEYSEFDEALISFQGLGLTRCVGPHFHEVELDIPSSRAQRILDRFSPAEQELLAKLAVVYSGPVN